jgi:hypothetical protein
MKAIVGSHPPKTGAEITFENKCPFIAATQGNSALLRVLNSKFQFESGSDRAGGSGKARSRRRFLPHL